MSTFTAQDHVALALDRLPEQYRGKAQIKGLLTGLVTPWNDLDAVFIALVTSRALATAQGVQLDQLGVVVGMERMGYSDSDFRLRLSAQILVNMSSGEAETLIRVYQILTGASVVVLSEGFPAEVGLLSDGALDSSQFDFAKALLESAAAGGVRIGYLGRFDATVPFAFAGNTLGPSGFGDVNDASQGGKLASIYIIGPYFQFAGNDPKGAGLTSVLDSFEGGRFSTL